MGCPVHQNCYTQQFSGKYTIQDCAKKCSFKKSSLPSTDTVMALIAGVTCSVLDLQCSDGDRFSHLKVLLNSILSLAFFLFLSYCELCTAKVGKVGGGGSNIQASSEISKISKIYNINISQKRHLQELDTLPKNMSLWVQPHIYNSNPKVEKQWKDTLHQALLNLTTTLIDHYKAVIRAEQDTLEEIKKETTEYLKYLSGVSREDEITKWKQQSKNAEEEARRLSKSLKENRESKLFQKRKQTEGMSNLRPNSSKQTLFPSTSKQPHLQTQPPTDLLEAFTGLLNSYSKNGQPQQQQQQQQQSTRGKDPANGRGFRRKGVPPTGH